MSIRKRPAEAVSVLLSRLEKAKEDAIEICGTLDLIRNDVDELKSSISTNDTLHLQISSEPTDVYEADESEPVVVISEVYRVDPGIEDQIYESNGMSRLLASFHSLESPQMKMCLLCLSVFPENSVIKKRCLIYWWMGEGIVAKNKDHTAEEVGEKLFQQLLDQDFVKPTASLNWRVNSFAVSPWIRRMLILAAEENGFLEFSRRRPLNGNRRVFLCGDENDSYGVREEDLLTVFNVEEQYLGTKPDWLMKLRNVEVLQMGRWQNSTTHHIEVKDEAGSLLDGLGSQKKLKYLSLRGISRIEALPASIAKLISLQILDLRACHNLEKLPQGISELTNLTHLDVSECYLLESMPKGLQHLLHLQVLKGFVIGKKGVKNSCRISDLAKLKKLRKLSVRVSSNEGETDQLSSLVGLSVLKILKISWGGDSLAAADLPRSLSKLDLWCVPFEAVPEWLWPSRLPDLDKLYIRGGKLTSLQHGDTGNNWTVKFLCLEYLNNFDFDDFEANKGSLFPEQLDFKKTPV